MSFRRVAIVLGLVLVLAVANLSILRHERVVRSGQTLVLALAPVDPRSLMQGDYMTLRFEAEDRIAEALRFLDNEMPDGAVPAPRFAVFRAPEPHAPAQYVGLAASVGQLGPGELAVRFSRTRGGHVRFGTDAYFFEEGRGEHFEAARFGEFRVDANGTAILVGLRDDAGRPL